MTTVEASVESMGTRPGATETDAVTGPLPVVDLADGHLHVSMCRNVTIIEADGGLDDRLAGLISPAIAAAVVEAMAVVLDLDQVTLLDRAALETVCDALGTGRLSAHDQCIVAGRLSGRLVLDRWEIPETMAVFTSVADALQAREFAASGYGNGWNPLVT